MSCVKTRHPHALLVIAALGLAACGPSTPVGNNVVETSPNAEAAPASTPPAKAAQPKPVAKPVGPGDFALRVKILSQDCFGSAGCNVSYRVQVLKAPKAGAYEITYDVGGVQDGPKTGNVTITDGEYDDTFLEDFASVKHKVKSLPVKVTSVEKR